MLESLSSNKSLPEPVEEGDFIYKIDDTLLLPSLSCRLSSNAYLSNVQQTN